MQTSKKHQIFLISKAFMLLEHKITSYHNITFYLQDTWIEADEMKGLKEICRLSLPILSLQDRSFSFFQSFVDIFKVHSTLFLGKPLFHHSFNLTSDMFSAASNLPAIFRSFLFCIWTHCIFLNPFLSYYIPEASLSYDYSVTLQEDAVSPLFRTNHNMSLPETKN